MQIYINLQSCRLENIKYCFDELKIVTDNFFIACMLLHVYEVHLICVYIDLGMEKEEPEVDCSLS